MADETGRGDDFSCSLTAVLVNRVRRQAGEMGVERLLRDSGSPRTLDYLEDIGNWVSYDEAVALWEVGQAVTQDPLFARHVGGDAVRVLGSSSLSTMLRSLGSPEELVRKLAVASHRFSTAADLEAVEVRPGYAEIRATARKGLPRHSLHCQWTTRRGSSPSECSPSGPTAIRLIGSSPRSARARRTTARSSRCTTRAPSSCRRSASCSRCTPATRRPRSTPPPRSQRPRRAAPRH